MPNARLGDGLAHRPGELERVETTAAGKQEGELFASRARGQVERPAGEALELKGYRLQTTVPRGPGPALQGKLLYAAVDRALYEAKRLGKNRVCSGC